MSEGQASDASSGDVEPGWHPDPWGHHQLRWWDGSEWTHQVHDDGAAAGGQTAGFDASSDVGMAQAAHLLTIVSSFVGPLIIWLVKGKESAFVEQHAKEALNFQISMAIYYTVSLFLMILLIGFVLLPVVFILDLVFTIQQTLKAGKGEASQYPLSIRLIK